MKRFNRIATMLLLVFLSFSLNATNPPATDDSSEPGQICVTVIIKCGNGKGTIYNGCGTSEEVAQDLRDVINYMCR